MNRDGLIAAFDDMQREAFRLQRHQSYAGVKGPEGEAWQAGKPLPVITSENHPWLKRMAGYTGAGKRVYDVHIVEWPLSEYRCPSSSGWPSTGIDWLTDRQTPTRRRNVRNEL